MSDLLFDTSALAKLYHQEPGTERMKVLLYGPGLPPALSECSLVEIYSAMARKAREEVFGSNDLGRLLDTFDDHVARGVYRVVPFQTDVRRQAQAIYRRHGTTSLIRSLDAIQLATALHLQAEQRDKVVTLVSADARLVAIAPKLGLHVLNPITS